MYAYVGTLGHGPRNNGAAIHGGVGEFGTSSIIGLPARVVIHITITKTNVETLSRKNVRVFLLMPT